MAFFVYIAILLVSISGILIELDWLTKPKLETKQPVQAASTAVPQAVPRAKPKADGPNPDLSPVYPKKDPPRVIEQVTAAPQPTQPTQPAPPAPETVGGAPPAPPSPVAATNNQAPAPQKPAETTGAATPADPSAPAPPAQMASAPALNSVVAAPNTCDMQACSTAYGSFRASDCTYQPFEGPRRVCQKPSEGGRKVASQPREARDETVPRRRGRDAELRDVERSVRQFTEQRGDADDDADFDEPRMGERRVIVIERPARW